MLKFSKQGPENGPFFLLVFRQEKHYYSCMNKQFVAKSYTATKKRYRIIGGKKHFFKSAWEANVARILQKMKEQGTIKEWFYEDKIFWFLNIKRGVRSYVPDFRIYTDDSDEFWEVKGYWDARSKTKIKRMAKYYPDVNIRIVDAKAYKQLTQDWKPIIGSEWE